MCVDSRCHGEPPSAVKWKKEKVNHSDAQHERFPLLHWWPVSTSSSLNQPFSSSKERDFQAAAAWGSWGQSWALKIVPNFIRDKWVWVTQRPHSSRASQIPSLWLCVIYRGEACHSGPEWDEPQRNTIITKTKPPKKAHWVWTMTKGLLQMHTRRHMHTLSSSTTVWHWTCVPHPQQKPDSWLLLLCFLADDSRFLFQTLQTYKLTDNCAETHEGVSLHVLRFCPFLLLCCFFPLLFFAWQPLNVEQHKTGLRQSAVDVCFLIRCISRKNGDLCWRRAVPQVVYQATLASLDVSAITALKRLALFHYRAARFAHWMYCV